VRVGEGKKEKVPAWRVYIRITVARGCSSGVALLVEGTSEEQKTFPPTHTTRAAGQGLESQPAG